MIEFGSTLRRAREAKGMTSTQLAQKTHLMVQQIEALENEETPKYFNLVEQKLLRKWEGMSVKKAEKARVDVVTGATVSSEAVIENVQRGLSYYNRVKR